MPRRASASSRSSSSRPRPCTRPRGAAVGRPRRRCARRASGRRAAPSRGTRSGGRPRGRGGRRPAGRAGMVRRTSGASAGSRRGSTRDHDHVGVDLARRRWSTADRASAAHTRSRTSRAGAHLDLAGAPAVRARASASAAIPPVTVQAPNRCSTYAVTPTQAGTSRGLVALGDGGVQRHQPEPLVLEPLAPARASVSRLRSRSASGAGRWSGSQGRSRYSRRSTSQSSA